MNIKQYLSGAALAMVALGFTACDGKDEPDYKPAVAPTDTERVFFATNTITQNIDKDDNSFILNVYRPESASDNEMTVQLLSSCAEEGVLSTSDYRSIITVPTEVTFAEGMPFAEIKIQYDAAAMVDNHPYPVAIAIDDAHADEYGNASILVNINKELFTEWALFAENPEIGRDGQGEYSFGLLFSSPEAPVQLLYREVPNNTKIKQFQLQWLINNKKPELGFETFMEFYTNDDMKNITVPVQPIYEHPSYGTVYFCDLYTYTGEDEDKGGSYYDAKSGTFTLNLIYFCEAGVFGEGDETLQLNGYVDNNDYTVGLSDNGQIVIEGEDIFILGFNLTKNTTLVGYTIVDGELEEEEVEPIAAAIIKEITAEDNETETQADEEGDEGDEVEYEIATIKKSGNVMLTFPKTSDYTVVAVGFKTNFENKYEAMSTNSLTFHYDTDPLRGFTLEAKDASFTNNFMSELTGEDLEETLKVDVYKSDDKDGLYRIANPFKNSKYAKELKLEINEFGCIDFQVMSNGKVFFPYSNIGLSDSGDKIGLCSTAYYLLAQGVSTKQIPAEFFGTFKDNKLVLNASTYVDEDGLFPNFIIGFNDQLSDYVNLDLNLDMNTKAAASVAPHKSLKGIKKLTPKALRPAVKKVAFPARFKANFKAYKPGTHDIKNVTPTRKRK